MNHYTMDSCLLQRFGKVEEILVACYKE